MDCMHFVAHKSPKVIEVPDHAPEHGYLWLDVDRRRDTDWVEVVERLAGVTIHEHHRRDLENVAHPSFFDSTKEYEMVIIRSLAPEDPSDIFATRAMAFLMTDRVLVSVHEPGSRSVATVRERLLQNQGRIPRRPVGLMQQVISAIVDRFMARRDDLDEQLLSWRDNLLDPRHPFDDWLALLRFGSKLRQLAQLCEEQSDALIAWHDATRVDVDDHLAVRVRDLQEHIGRVSNFATTREADIESLVQLHFSAVAHRTNEIMRVLTVLSAIFLPLGLVAGIFGMNFEYMPELKYHFSYYIALGGMAALGIGLFTLFKVRRWV